MSMKRALIKACVAEFVGTFALVFVGLGAVANLTGDHAGLLGIALAQGLTIAVMVTATAAISGGHLNPAITFGMLVGGKICPSRAVAYCVSQLLGATTAAALMMSVVGANVVAMGTPDLSPKISIGTGVMIEIILTFFLVFVFFGTIVDSRAPKLGGFGVGFTVAVSTLVGNALSGAALNPARTFGTAFISSHWSNHIVFWVGPLVGGLLAGVVYGRFLIRQETPIETPATIAAAARTATPQISVK
jgi:MIP family channel proteins